MKYTNENTARINYSETNNNYTKETKEWLDNYTIKNSTYANEHEISTIKKATSTKTSKQKRASVQP